MYNYWLFFGWFCFTLATINTIAYGIRYSGRDLPADFEHIFATIFIGLLYTLWFKIITWKSQ